MDGERWRGKADGPDVGGLVELLRGPVRPRPEFRESLRGELRREQATLYGEGGGDPHEALCPFTSFCFAELRLPGVARRNCPCLASAGVLERLAARGVPLRRRHCHGKALRAAAG